MEKEKKFVKVPRIFRSREFIIAVLLVVASLVISIFSPVFLSIMNIKSMLLSVSVNGIICVGMVMLLALGELDLSVGMTMAFTGVVCGQFLVSGVPIPLAIILALLIAALIGVINGVFVAKIGLNSFIVTLGMMSCLEGLMLVIANGTAITGLPQAYKNIGQGSIAGIQYPIIVLVIIVVIADILFRNHKGMRQIVYIGSNENAAKLSGIKVSRVKILTFVTTAALSGLVGILFAARLGSASVTIGSSTAMDAITACIIGGSSLQGGKGSVLGAVLGALFLSALSSALNLLGVNIYWQNFYTGAILILAILIDAFSERRKNAMTKAL